MVLGFAVLRHFLAEGVLAAGGRRFLGWARAKDGEERGRKRGLGEGKEEEGGWMGMTHSLDALTLPPRACYKGFFIYLGC